MFASSKIIWFLRYPYFTIALFRGFSTSNLIRLNGIKELYRVLVDDLPASIMDTRSMIVQFYGYILFCYIILIQQMLCIHYLVLDRKFLNLGLNCLANRELDSIFIGKIRCSIVKVNPYFRDEDDKVAQTECVLRFNAIYQFIYLMIWFIYLFLFIVITVCLIQLIVFTFSNQRRTRRIVELLPGCNDEMICFLSDRRRFFVLESLVDKLNSNEFSDLMNLFIRRHYFSIELIRHYKLIDDLYQIQEVESIV